MKFEIPYDKKIYLYQCKLISSLVFGDLFKSARNLFTAGFIIFIIGLFAYRDRKGFGIIIFVIGFSILIDSFSKYWKYKNSRKVYLETIEKEINGQIDNLGNGVFEFTPDFVIFQDKTYSRKLKWIDFKSYKLISNNLLLIINEKESDIMALGLKEIGKENFTKVIKLVRSKIK